MNRIIFLYSSHCIAVFLFLSVLPLSVSKLVDFMAWNGFLVILRLLLLFLSRVFSLSLFLSCKSKLLLLMLVSFRVIRHVRQWRESEWFMNHRLASACLSMEMNSNLDSFCAQFDTKIGFYNAKIKHSAIWQKVMRQKYVCVCMCVFSYWKHTQWANDLLFYQSKLTEKVDKTEITRAANYLKMWFYIAIIGMTWRR